jgi:AAA+ ATPase superfamily predicted ATPase
MSRIPSQNAFFGRKQELRKLGLLLKKNSASLVVIKGRRRIGKSRLIEEFGQGLKMISIAGLAPTNTTTLQDELNAFGWQLGEALGHPPFKDNDWNTLFSRLANETKEGRILILLDEISWMGSKDPHFLGKLKNAWDQRFKKNPELMLVLCGSVSAWIEKNILGSTGFLGRISLNLTLDELSLKESNEFWTKHKENISAYEKFKILSVTGGVPKYLEEIQTNLPAEENIKNLCFDKSGLLFDEFNHIFTDIFSKRSEIYKRIVQSISDGYYEHDDICKKLNIEKSGILSRYLEELVLSGFIRRDYTWHLKNRKISKLSRYRISDNYLRFYLNYISPNREQIEKGRFEHKSLTSMPGWEGMMGLQFENLVLHNRNKIIELLQINPNDVVYDNPFFQNKTQRQEGCQIDYMIQTRFDTLYICEVKFSKQPIKMSVISQVREKIKKLKVPRHISRRPVLIHVNGITENVLDSEFFSDVVNFGDLL